MGPAKKTVFNKKWLDDDEFKLWLREDSSDKHSSYCTFCKKSFSLSNMGKQALTSHTNSKKHTQIVKDKNNSYNINLFHQHLEKKDDSSPKISTSSNNKNVYYRNNTSISTSEDTPVKQSTLHSTLSNFIERDEITKAEIKWALHCVSSHLSMSAGGSSIEVMKDMFTDSKIASSLKLQRTKLTYTIVHGLARYFRTQLIDIVKNVPCFTISFDESLNKIAEKQQMDIYIRYWDDEINEVSCRYYNSAFLGHTTAVDMIDALKISLQPLHLNRILQVSMDGPNVNIKLLRDLKMELKTSDPTNPVILDLGTCGLHTLHNGFKMAMKSAKWNIVVFLRAIYNLFKHVPARRAEYIKITGSNKFPLKFCAVRWLNNFSVAERAEEMLPYLIQYVKVVKDLKKEPTSYSYEIMSKSLQYKLLKPRLAFFKTLAAELEPFLKRFQVDVPMGPYLYTDLSNILKSFMNRFVRPELLNNKSLASIDIFDKTNLIGPKNINLGYMTREAIRSTDGVTDLEMLIFRKECNLILQTFCSKLLSKSPLKYKIVRGITFCDPLLISSSTLLAIERIKLTIEIFVENQWLSGISGDRIEREFSILCSNPTFIESTKKYSSVECRIDNFWSNIVIKYGLQSDLTNFLKKVLILSHGQADVERGFSINKECLITNLKEESLIGQRHVYSALQKAGGVKNINITKELIMVVRNSRTYYEEALKEKQRAREEHLQYEEKKKRKKQELNMLHEKKIRLMEVMQKEKELIEKQIDALL